KRFMSQLSPLVLKVNYQLQREVSRLGSTVSKYASENDRLPIVRENQGVRHPISQHPFSMRGSVDSIRQK
ncbi:MAG: hypothetical protein ABI847_10190, partial [Anaerolineales bacterium]